ncbi:MAG TPA: hypothetical protein PKM73_14060 [Verrucomicrobiota bacterium]|nr:hypothetical protein [Verrucomicrobiota bacterium]HNU53052.1 hypothetical protein [Verrucomicrobiota bacterium]
MRPRIGLVAVTLELYETLVPGLRASREGWLRRAVIPVLETSAEVLFGGAVFGREAVESAVSDHERAGVDALVVVHLTYAPSQVLLPALQRARVPIVLWNTQELGSVDASFTMAMMIDNHGVHGTQDLANVLRRSGVRFEYVTGGVGEAGVLEELADAFAAAAAVGRLRRARVGLLGHPFPGMGDFAVDTTHWVATLGCEWRHLSVADYIERSAGADGAAVGSLVKEYEACYDVAADVTAADLEATARAECALRSMVREHGLSAITYQFMAFGEDDRCSTVPFVGASRLMAEGVGFGGEGDVVSAAATAFFQWLAPPASFTEIFTMDAAGESVLLSHMGEANVGMARRDRKVPLVARATPITRTRDRQLALVTCFEPGPATLTAMSLGSGGRWQVIAARGEVLDFGPLPGFCVPHSKWRPAGGLRRFLTGYGRAGGPHHNALCFGDACGRLRLAAGLLGAEYVELG